MIEKHHSVEQTFLSVGRENNSVEQAFLPVDFKSQTEMSELPSGMKTQTRMSELPSGMKTQTGMSELLHGVTEQQNNKVEQAFLPVDTQQLKISKRNLPHWQFGGSFYFITFRTINNGELNTEEKIQVYNHILDGNNKFYHLVSLVVMPDHVHLILRPNDGYNLSRIMKGIKGVSSHKINQINKVSGSVWQSESFDRIIRNEEELYEKVNYMLNNPLKRGLCDDPYKYEFWYLNKDYDCYMDNKVEQTFVSIDNENDQVEQTFVSVKNQTQTIVDVDNKTQTGMSELPNGISEPSKNKVEQAFLPVDFKPQTRMSELPQRMSELLQGMSELPIDEFINKGK